MKTVNTPAASKPSPNVSRKPATNLSDDVVVKQGQSGLRFGPVVTGQVALGKDGCGY